MIPFNVPVHIGKEEKYIYDAIHSHKISGDGKYTKKCSSWLENRLEARKVLLTTSGTSALDMTAMLCDISDGDEVILPSYTFSSTANAFAIQGARLVFVDIRPDTMNIDESIVEDAITKKTKAIVAVHYAGVSCEMDKIQEIADKYNLFIIEDAAQGMLSSYKGRSLGTIGDLGCYSFHETKNYTMGEGGAIILNEPRFIERAEILREKGTNRSKYFRGEIDKYTWVDLGDSFLPSDLNAAYLYAQLEYADQINENRLETWNGYYCGLQDLENKGRILLPRIPKDCSHNAHMFYIKTRNLQERTDLIRYLKSNEISATFHYIPLHSAPAGKRYGRFHGEDRYTTKESERLLRLPMYYGLCSQDQEKIIDCIISFYKSR